MADQLPLWEIFERYYRPAKLPGAGTQVIANHRTSIRKFAAFLGREPTTNDLRPDVVRRFVKRLAKQPQSYNIRLGHRKRIGRLWTFAYESGFVAMAPELPPFSSYPRRRRPQLPPPKDGTLRHFFSHDYADLPGRRLRDGTRNNYDRALGRLYNARGDDIALVDCTEGALQVHREWLCKTGVPPYQVEREIGFLRTMFLAASRKALAPFMPRMRRPRMRRPLTQEARRKSIWTVDDVRRLFDAAQTAKRPNTPHCTPPNFWRALISLAWYTGAWQCKLLRLRLQDIDVTERTVIVDERRFRFPPEAVEALATVINGRRQGELFDWRQSRVALLMQSRVLMASAGIPAVLGPDERLGNVRIAGASIIAAWLGHANPRDVLTSAGYDLQKGLQLSAKRKPIVATEWWLPSLSGRAYRPTINPGEEAIAVARAMHAAGDLGGAVLTLGVAVTAELRRLRRQVNANQKHQSLALMAKSLARAGVIDAALEKQLAWFAEIKSRAIVAEWRRQPALSAADVGTAIDVGEQFLDRFALRATG